MQHLVSSASFVTKRLNTSRVSETAINEQAQALIKAFLHKISYSNDYGYMFMGPM